MSGLIGATLLAKGFGLMLRGPMILDNLARGYLKDPRAFAGALDFKLDIRGARRLVKTLQQDRRNEVRAFETAVKVEAFQQRRKLQTELRAGRPGGHRLAPLSRIGRRTKTGRMKKNQAPLSGAAKMVRYDVRRQPSGKLGISFGFVDSGTQRLSMRWKQLLQKHQEGTDILYSGSRRELGRRMARIGGRLKKKGDPDAKYFFLRRGSGRKLGVKNRPIVDPYWEAHEAEAWRNIRKNYRRKLRGERI